MTKHLPVFGQPLVGTPKIRDVDSPCLLFEEGGPHVGNTCEGDGHYMCRECAHWKWSQSEDSTRFDRIAFAPGVL